MKKEWLIILILFLTNQCFAQDSWPLKNVSYYSVGSVWRIAEIKLTDDSLYLSEKSETAVVAKQPFKIIDEEQREDFILVYVSNDQLLNFPRKLNPSQIFHIISLFIFSADKNKVLVQRQVYPLHILPNKIEVTSLEQVKAANAADQFKNNYFFTWYAPSKFTAFTHYNKLEDADKTTIQKVADDWLHNLQQHRAKMKTNPGNGGNYYRDNLTKALIKNHLNPVVETDDLYKKLIEYHITLSYLPEISRKYVIPLEPRIDDPSQDIKIDEPVGSGKH